MSGARITWRCRAQIIAEPGRPLLRIVESAYLPCGCTVHLARRLDDGDAATGAVPCSPDHHPLIERFNELWRTSLAEPTDFPAIKVIAHYLDQAAGEEPRP